MSEIRSMTSETSWVAAKAEARKAIYDTGRGMIGRERNYLEDRVARAILAAEKRAEALLAETRKKALEEALEACEEIARLQQDYHGDVNTGGADACVAALLALQENSNG